MTPNDIMQGLQAKNRELTSKNAELSSLVDAAAEAERVYHIAYAKRIIELKAEGHPVTLIPTLAKGDPAVSDLRFKQAVADGVLDACRQRIKDVREAIGTYRSLLRWLREEMTLTPSQEA